MEPDYKAAFNILMDYWDFIPDDEKPLVDQRLRLVIDNYDYEPTTADEYNQEWLNKAQNGTLEDISPKSDGTPHHKIKESLKRLKDEYGFGVPD